MGTQSTLRRMSRLSAHDSSCGVAGRAWKLLSRIRSCQAWTFFMVAASAEVASRFFVDVPRARLAATTYPGSPALLLPSSICTPSSTIRRA